MKTLEFIYQETEIHFCIYGDDKDVMVNASEMAQLFERRTKDFLKTEHAKAFIKVAKRAPNGARIIENRGRNGIYFNKRLALKFAAWLSPEFEYWVYSTIDEIVFGNYKKHWQAHAQQEAAKIKMQELKEQMLSSPTAEVVRNYFEQERILKEAKNAKTRAIKNQLNLFNSDKTLL